MWALSLMLACIAAFAQDPAYPTREYIRLGDRLIAIENAVSQITIVPPTRNVIGPGETAQFGKTVSGIPAESVRWAVESGPGTISLEGGLYQAPTPVAAEQTATIKATSTADASVVAVSSIMVRPLLLPASASMAGSGGTGVVTVTKEGAWTASVTSGSGWITVTSGASGNGNGEVRYSVTSNAPSAREGALTIAGTVFAITQAAGTAGQVTWTPQSVSNVSYNGVSSLTVAVGAPAAASWVAVSDRSWLLIDSGGSGTGNGTVSYSVMANTSYEPRDGHLLIGDSGFTVSQQGKPPQLGCSAIPSPVPSGGGTYTLTLGAATMATWIGTINSSGFPPLSPTTGTGSGQMNVTFPQNSDVNERSVAITVTVTTNGQNALLSCSGLQAGRPILDIRPSVVQLTAWQTVQFNAYLWRPNEEYVDNSAVTWSVDGGDQPTINGTIDQSGAYTEVDPVFWTACLSGSAALRMERSNAENPQDPPAEFEGEGRRRSHPRRQDSR